MLILIVLEGVISLRHFLRLYSCTFVLSPCALVAIVSERRICLRPGCSCSPSLNPSLQLMHLTSLQLAVIITL